MWPTEHVYPFLVRYNEFGIGTSERIAIEARFAKALEALFGGPEGVARARQEAEQTVSGEWSDACLMARRSVEQALRRALPGEFEVHEARETQHAVG